MIREMSDVELIRVVRNYTISTMFPLSSLLESRNCALRTMQRIQKEVQQTKAGCNLNPGLRDQESRHPWCSTRQDRSEKRIPRGLECVEEMLWQGRLPKVNILQVFTIDFSEIHFIVNHSSQSDGQKKCKEWDEFWKGPYMWTHSRGRRYKGQWYLTLNTAGKNEASIWLQSPCLDEKSLTPRIRRTNWRAHPSRSTKTNATRTRSFLWWLLLQRSSWPTYRMGILDAIFKFLVVVHIKNFFIWLRSLFFTVGFVHNW